MNRKTWLGGILVGASLLLFGGVAYSSENGGITNDSQAIAALDSADAQVRMVREYLANKQQTATATPTPTPTPTGTQTLGVGGVATPTDAKSLPAASNGKVQITSAGVYDCKGATVAAMVEVKAAGTTLQNCVVNPNKNYAIYVTADKVTIQNNDIKGLTGPGDINGITAFGNDIKIKFNTMINAVSNPGDSHSDAIQTWVSTSHPTASSNWEIRGNKFVGPANPSRDNSIPSIHQVIMVEDYGRGGNSGGQSTGMRNWLVIGNEFGASWGQDIKNDGVDGFIVTKNKFVGSSSSVMQQANGTGLQFFSDNIIGSGYGKVGVPITAGAGPN